MRQKIKAKHVSDLVGDVLSDVVRRRSGMTINLIAGWPDIVGPDYAGFTRPEKIQWPKRSSDADPFQPGTLIVACEGSKALFFQHETDQIVNKVNLFFGFDAIDRIKLTQKSVAAKKKHKAAPVPLSETDKRRLGDVLENITDARLREKLERFGKGVFARKTRISDE